MRCFIMLWPALAVFGAGCGSDIKEIADQQVARNLLASHERREAIPFFENRGRFFDTDESTTVDHDVVLPLLKTLAEVADTDQWVILRPAETDWAFALLVKLPRDPGIVDRMAAAVEQVDAGFPGLILQQWGHEWLSMDLIDQETYAFMKKSNPDIDKQR
ncbi:MAG TPA: hypothetical protein VGM05_05935 [Planctomycetaceae bacterium]|jgi:hypothetical protein